MIQVALVTATDLSFGCNAFGPVFKLRAVSWFMPVLLIYLLH